MLCLLKVADVREDLANRLPVGRSGLQFDDDRIAVFLSCSNIDEPGCNSLFFATIDDPES